MKFIFQPRLRSFYKPCSKKFGLNVWSTILIQQYENTSGYNPAGVTTKVIFHGNAGKRLQCHAKSEAHSVVIQAITSTRIDRALLDPIGIQEKTDISKMYVL